MQKNCLECRVGNHHSTSQTQRSGEKILANNFKPNLSRLGLILFVIFILFSLLVIKLFKVQFIDAENFIKKANNTELPSPITIIPTRGEIFDRRGYPLATNILKYDIGCEPLRITNKGWFTEIPNENMLPITKATTLAAATLKDVRVSDIESEKGMARILSQLLELDVDYVHRAIQGNSAYHLLSRKVNASIVEKLRRFRLAGIVFDGISQRTYPEENLGSSLIGWTGIDNQGLSGIESAFNSILSGTEGERIRSRNTTSSSNHDITIKPSVDGMDIYLSIDSIVQLLAEQELARSCEEWGAKSGCCVIADVATGEILAMASYPTFNLNNWSNTEASIRNTNRAIHFSYEPGSVIKGLVTAIALEEDVINEETRFQCSRYKKIADSVFECPLKAHGDQDLLGIINNSCNIGFIDVGKKLGKNKFFKGLSSFGFGQIPESGLGGESGTFKKAKWATDLPAMSFGRSMTATPLQLVMAYSALANDGIMMKPLIIRQEYNPNNGESTIREPTIARRVVSEETSVRTMKLLTANAKLYGKGKPLVPGYNIAGKTGTAHMWDKTRKKYFNHKYNCSFVGIVPSDQTAERKLVVFITIEDPIEYKNGVRAWGSSVAAPCFKNLAPKVLSALHIPESPKEEINENN